MFFVIYIFQETRNIIGKEIKEANIYSVFADTTPDISHQDRLALCVRYFNSRGKAVERLLEMEKRTDKTGLGTTSQIINILESNLLNSTLISFNPTILQVICPENTMGPMLNFRN